MTPRPYRMARRQEATDETRLRIIDAARELLASRDGSVRFSLDAVARRAGVARMTVYHQFGSLRGLLEGLLDSVAFAGGMKDLPDIFRHPDAVEALDGFIAVFMRFWEHARPVRRGLAAMAVLDPEFAAALEERSGWRREGLRTLLGRLAKQTGRPKPKEMDDAIDLLYTLTSFHTYDSLAGSKRSAEQVTRMVQRLAREALAGS
jgi:AcrR family transcriptional regulator